MTDITVFGWYGNRNLKADKFYIIMFKERLLAVLSLQLIVSEQLKDTEILLQREELIVMLLCVGLAPRACNVVCSFGRPPCNPTNERRTPRLCYKISRQRFAALTHVSLTHILRRSHTSYLTRVRLTRISLTSASPVIHCTRAHNRPKDKHGRPAPIFSILRGNSTPHKNRLLGDKRGHTASFIAL